MSDGEIPIRDKGILKWFDNVKGFGFCKREGFQDVFLHANALRRSGVLPETLKAGDTLEFAVVPVEGKGPKAAEIKILARAPA